jgi:tRNA(fMet)-specific endonuclease VapC
VAVILDTNGLSAVADGDPRLARIIRGANKIAVPAIVLGEYRYGISQSRNRIRDEQWLTMSIKVCRVLVVDADTAEQYSDVRAELTRSGKPTPANDLWIAALARQHAMPLLSRDRHVDFVPRLKRIGW